MNLDLSTLMTMESFVQACAGAILLAIWSQNRKTLVLAIWGVADLVAAAGILVLMRGAALHDPSWSAAGGAVLLLTSGLNWKAARTLDAKPAPWAFAIGGMVIFVALVAAARPLREIAGSLTLAAGAGYLFAAAGSLWLGRKDRLPARLPLVILAALHASVLSLGAYSTLLDGASQDAAPPTTSFFGLIHFESIVFALGAAVFLLALVKERSEAATKATANVDPLTGIANRAALMASAERIIERCRLDGAPVCVMMFDLDRFKAVNDTHGHAVGDAVIRKFCETTAAALSPNEVFGRIGGEEFVVVSPESSIEAAGLKAERIRVAFAKNCRFIGDRQVNATVSAGVSMGVNGEHALPQLLEKSDSALYRAKANGRNCVRRADLHVSQHGSSSAPRVA